jgi:hypothetical protein
MMIHNSISIYVTFTVGLVAGGGGCGFTLRFQAQRLFVLPSGFWFGPFGVPFPMQNCIDHGERTYFIMSKDSLIMGYFDDRFLNKYLKKNKMKKSL